ncbi:MAG: hypothetical protein JJE37_15405, partial [Methyloceanibacter sp.]|nr:hypothetical protein [Methyloceanibacter sp.]
MDHRRIRRDLRRDRAAARWRRRDRGGNGAPSDKLDTLAASNERIKAFPADVLKPDELKEAVAKIESALGAIDLALLGAGM